MEKINIKNFINSYLATASWVTVDSDTECAEFTRNAKKIALADCEKFIELVKERIGNDKAIGLLTIPCNNLDYLTPHCFFLDRNGHGTGFWDRQNEYGEYADILSDISKEMGSSDCYHVRGKKSKLTF